MANLFKTLCTKYYQNQPSGTNNGADRYDTTLTSFYCYHFFIITVINVIIHTNQHGCQQAKNNNEIQIGLQYTDCVRYIRFLTGAVKNNQPMGCDARLPVTQIGTGKCWTNDQGIFLGCPERNDGKKYPREGGGKCVGRISRADVPAKCLWGMSGRIVREVMFDGKFLHRLIT